MPFSTIQVPDPDIQGMIEASVRNIWQAREIKRGLPAFHVGPTVYRGLWVVDGSFLLESAAILGRGQDARAGVEYLLGHQKPDGSFEILLALLERERHRALGCHPPRLPDPGQGVAPPGGRAAARLSSHSRRFVPGPRTIRKALEYRLAACRRDRRRHQQPNASPSIPTPTGAWPA